MKIINVTPKYQYIFDNGKVVKEELVKEKGIITSFLHPKDLISITKKFDKNLSEDTILLEMEKYIYSYPGIDLNKEYHHIFLKVERENYLILEALLIDVEEVKKNFADIFQIYKYIDFISPSFLAYEEYYKLNKLPTKNDIFIYFSENDAFLVAYSEGKYLFHKSLNRFQALEKMLDKKEDEVIELLTSKGLDISSYENHNEFNIVDKFFSEFFLKAFNVMNFSLNEYQIPKFDRIIFYSPFEVKNLFEQYENYWAMNGVEFKKSVVATEYDHLEYLITIFNANNYANEDINLSIFSSPPSIIKTKAGQFLLFLIFSVLSIIGYVFYEKYSLEATKKEISHLEEKYLKIKKMNPKKVKMVEKYKKENKILNSKIALLNKKIEVISSKIDILYKKAKEPLFYNVLAKVAGSMKKYSLKVQSLTKTDNHIRLIIVSNKENTENIPFFLDDLINFGFKNVKSKYVSKETNFYISQVDFDYE